MRRRLGLFVLTVSSFLLLGCSQTTQTRTRIIAPSYSYLVSPEGTSVQSDGRVLATATDQDVATQP